MNLSASSTFASPLHFRPHPSASSTNPPSNLGRSLSQHLDDDEHPAVVLHSDTDAHRFVRTAAVTVEDGIGQRLAKGKVIIELLGTSHPLDEARNFVGHIVDDAYV